MVNTISVSENLRRPEFTQRFVICDKISEVVDAWHACGFDLENKCDEIECDACSNRSPMQLSIYYIDMISLTCFSDNMCQCISEPAVVVLRYTG